MLIGSGTGFRVDVWDRTGQEHKAYPCFQVGSWCINNFKRKGCHSLYSLIFFPVSLLQQGDHAVSQLFIGGRWGLVFSFLLSLKQIFRDRDRDHECEPDMAESA
jgi:hypothetical protein